MIYCKECREDHPQVVKIAEEWRKIRIILPMFGEKSLRLNPHVGPSIWPGATETFLCPWCKYVRPFYGTSSRTWPNYQDRIPEAEKAWMEDEPGTNEILLYPCTNPACFSRSNASIEKEWARIWDEAHRENQRINREKFEKEWKAKSAREADEKHLREWQDLLSRAKKKIIITIGHQEGSKIVQKKHEIPVVQLGKVFAIHKKLEFWDLESKETEGDIPYLGEEYVVTHIVSGLSIVTLIPESYAYNLPNCRKLFHFLEENCTEDFMKIKSQKDVSKVLSKDWLRETKNRISHLFYSPNEEEPLDE